MWGSCLSLRAALTLFVEEDVAFDSTFAAVPIARGRYQCRVAQSLFQANLDVLDKRSLLCIR